MYRYFFVVAQSGTAIIDEECITRPSAKQTKKIVKDYGDSHLFSTLCSLVNMRLLANGPHWTLSNPTYFCAIDGSLAEDIARSLSVPLNDILQHWLISFLAKTKSSVFHSFYEVQCLLITFIPEYGILHFFSRHLTVQPRVLLLCTSFRSVIGNDFDSYNWNIVIMLVLVCLMLAYLPTSTSTTTYIKYICM